ncbi:MAG: hypothetical protein GY948_10455 [Alphaproteobacteria bacterium]|nr:hypothetical protein [Alphaproteobacteria bacterium]
MHSPRAGNSRLKTLSAPWSKDVATRWRRGNKEKLRRFFQTRYGAGSWSKERRVIARVEASWQGTDVRFIVTNLVGGRSKHLYEKVYCARGKMENPLLGHAGMPCQAADQGTQTLHQVRPHFLSSLGGQPVPRSAGKPSTGRFSDPPHSCTPVPTGCC